MIRKYKDEDLEFVQEQDAFAGLLIQYNKNVEKENVFTMTDDEGNILGVLALEYHYTWYSKNEDLNKVVIIAVTKENDEKVEGALIEYAKVWVENNKDRFKDKNICLAAWIEDNEYCEIQKYLSHGFLESEICSCLKFDLTKEIPNYTLPQGMKIEELQFNEDEVNKFIKCTELGNNGTADSINELWFMSGDPSYKIFVVKENENILSSACVWKITDERSAVENIFTIPGYRNRNLARSVITHALKAQKEQGYKMGTLSVSGKNKKALKLYLSLGFNLYFNQVELHYK